MHVASITMLQPAKTTYVTDWVFHVHRHALTQDTERLTEDQRLLANFSGPMQRVMLYEAEHFEGDLNQTLHGVWDRVVNLLQGLENVTGVPLPSNVTRPGNSTTVVPTTAPPTNPQQDPANRNTAPGSVSVGKLAISGYILGLNKTLISFFVCRTTTTMMVICLMNFRFVKSVTCFNDKSLLLPTCKSCTRGDCMHHYTIMLLYGNCKAQLNIAYMVKKHTPGIKLVYINESHA